MHLVYITQVTSISVTTCVKDLELIKMCYLGNVRIYFFMNINACFVDFEFLGSRAE